MTEASFKVVHDILANAELLLRTDGGGALVSTEMGADVAVDPADLVEILDLALATVSQLGARCRGGALDAALLMYRGRLVAVAETPDSGRVALVARANAQPGLLLRDVRRLVNAYARETEAT